MVAVRLLVTGGRAYDDAHAVARILDRALVAVLAAQERLVVVHGAADGLDTLAHRWCIWRAAEGAPVDVEPYPADWSRGRGAGIARNAEMVALGANACLSFPGGRGTADCTQRASNAGIRIGVVDRRGVLSWR